MKLHVKPHRRTSSFGSALGSRTRLSRLATGDVAPERKYDLLDQAVTNATASVFPVTSGTGIEHFFGVGTQSGRLRGCPVNGVQTVQVRSARGGGWVGSGLRFLVVPSMTWAGLRISPAVETKGVSQSP